MRAAAVALRNAQVGWAGARGATAALLRLHGANVAGSGPLLRALAQFGEQAGGIYGQIPEMLGDASAVLEAAPHHPDASGSGTATGCIDDHSMDRTRWTGARSRLRVLEGSTPSALYVRKTLDPVKQRRFELDVSTGSVLELTLRTVGARLDVKPQQMLAGLRAYVRESSSISAEVESLQVIGQRLESTLGEDAVLVALPNIVATDERQEWFEYELRLGDGSPIELGRVPRAVTRCWAGDLLLTGSGHLGLGHQHLHVCPSSVSISGWGNRSEIGESTLDLLRSLILIANGRDEGWVGVIEHFRRESGLEMSAALERRIRTRFSSLVGPDFAEANFWSQRTGEPTPGILTWDTLRLIRQMIYTIDIGRKYAPNQGLFRGDELLLKLVDL